MKKKAIVVCLGYAFYYFKHLIYSNYEVVAIVDNSKEKQGTEIDGYTVKALSSVDPFSYDTVLVTTSHDMIQEQLNSLHIDKEVIAVDRNLFPFDSFSDYVKFKRNLRISVSFIGGVGDFLIGRKWLDSVLTKYNLKNSEVDIYVYSYSIDNAKSAFNNWDIHKNLKSISKASIEISSGYDVVLQFCIFPFVYSFVGENLYLYNKSFFDYVINLQKFGYENFNYGFYKNNFFYKNVRNLFEKLNKKYHTFYDVLSNLNANDDFGYELPILIDESEYLKKCGLDCPYITLSTGLNKEYKSFTDNTRAWDMHSWNNLSLLIKKKFEYLKTVQIGLDMSEKEKSKADVSLSGKTSFEELKCILKNSILHVDYDGGLVHIRHILHGGPSIVLFGPSSKKWHEYEENISIQTDVCMSCEWTSEQWLKKCPKGFDYPICMKSITPEKVLKYVEIAMKKYDLQRGL